MQTEPMKVTARARSSSPCSSSTGLCLDGVSSLQLPPQHVNTAALTAAAAGSAAFAPVSGPNGPLPMPAGAFAGAGAGAAAWQLPPAVPFFMGLAAAGQAPLEPAWSSTDLSLLSPAGLLLPPLQAGFFGGAAAAAPGAGLGAQGGALSDPWQQGPDGGVQQQPQQVQAAQLAYLPPFPAVGALVPATAVPAQQAAIQLPVPAFDMQQFGAALGASTQLALPSDAAVLLGSSSMEASCLHGMSEGLSHNLLDHTGRAQPQQQGDAPVLPASALSLLDEDADLQAPVLPASAVSLLDQDADLQGLWDLLRMSDGPF